MSLQQELRRVAELVEDTVSPVTSTSSVTVMRATDYERNLGT